MSSQFPSWNRIMESNSGSGSVSMLLTILLLWYPEFSLRLSDIRRIIIFESTCVVYTEDVDQHRGLSWANARDNIKECTRVSYYKQVLLLMSIVLFFDWQNKHYTVLCEWAVSYCLKTLLPHIFWIFQCRSRRSFSLWDNNQ